MASPMYQDCKRNGLLPARIHDESVRFVLSDHSIVSVAVEVPKSPALLYDTISLADLNSEPASVSSLQSPSPVVCSHLEDFFFLIHEKDDLENVFQMLIHKCLGPNGSCPLSLYNYALLFNHDLRFSNIMSTKQNGSRNTKHIARKASRDLFVQKFSCKAPVYHNCRIYANDGRLLCYCDRRKLEWYLRRDLAKLVDDDPPAIMLLFEPKGRPEDEDNDFYIQSKKNICVSCGEGSHYLRYRIIPSCYRMHFPEHLKSHRSHDIVLLCVDCHEVAHAAAEKYKKQVAAEFGIPLFVRKVVDSKEQPAISWPDSHTTQLDEAGVSPLQLRTAAMALLRHGQRMPPERRGELMQTVMQYYGGRDISEEDLENALVVGMSPHERRKFEKKRGFSCKHGFGKNLQDTKQNNVATKFASDGAPRTNDSISGNFGESCSNEAADLQFGHAESSPSKLSLLGHGPHGKQVVDHILEHYGEDGICNFCQKWRKVFVEATQPRFLPAGWDVMHSGRRDFGEFSVYNPAKKASAAKC